jgi:hypothetical protein
MRHTWLANKLHDRAAGASSAALLWRVVNVGGFFPEDRREILSGQRS